MTRHRNVTKGKVVVLNTPLSHLHELRINVSVPSGPFLISLGSVWDGCLSLLSDMKQKISSVDLYPNIRVREELGCPEGPFGALGLVKAWSLLFSDLLMWSHWSLRRIRSYTLLHSRESLLSQDTGLVEIEKQRHTGVVLNQRTGPSPEARVRRRMSGRVRERTLKTLLRVPSSVSVSSTWCYTNLGSLYDTRTSRDSRPDASVTSRRRKGSPETLSMWSGFTRRLPGGSSHRGNMTVNVLSFQEKKGGKRFLVRRYFLWKR